MLCLCRKVGESVEIMTPDGTMIEVTVIEVLKDQEWRGLRLGFTAPRSVQIDRKEIADAKRAGRQRVKEPATMAPAA